MPVSLSTRRRWRYQLSVTAIFTYIQAQRSFPSLLHFFAGSTTLPLPAHSFHCWEPNPFENHILTNRRWAYVTLTKFAFLCVLQDSFGQMMAFDQIIFSCVFTSVSKTWSGLASTGSRTLRESKKTASGRPHKGSRFYGER